MEKKEGAQGGGGRGEDAAGQPVWLLAYYLLASRRRGVREAVVGGGGRGPRGFDAAARCEGHEEDASCLGSRMVVAMVVMVMVVGWTYSVVVRLGGGGEGFSFLVSFFLGREIWGSLTFFDT